MIARRIHVVFVLASKIEGDDGWQAPDGWRIVNSEKAPTIGSEQPYYRITLVKS